LIYTVPVENSVSIGMTAKSIPTWNLSDKNPHLSLFLQEKPFAEFSDHQFT
jgi:hypothetical protein